MISIFLTILDNENEKDRFQEIYNKYKYMMGKLAYTILKDEDLAFDATQSALYAIAKNIKTFPPSTDERYERAYVQKVVRHCAIDKIRKNKKRPQILNLDLYYDKIGVSEINSICDNDEIKMIKQYIMGMPEIYKNILFFRYIYGMDVHSICKVTCLSENTVRSRIRRGTLMLQNFIIQAGIR